MPLAFVVSALISVALDQISKFMALSSLTPSQSVEVIPGVFHITLVMNPGAAFGLLLGRTFLVVTPVLAIIALALVSRQNRQGWMPLALGLAAGGALGNLIDRIRLEGRVVDFLDFLIWPVFNVADIAITLGAGLIIIEIFRHERRRGS